MRIASVVLALLFMSTGTSAEAESTDPCGSIAEGLRGKFRRGEFEQLADLIVPLDDPKDTKTSRKKIEASLRAVLREAGFADDWEARPEMEKLPAGGLKFQAGGSDRLPEQRLIAYQVHFAYAGAGYIAIQVDTDARACLPRAFEFAFSEIDDRRLGEISSAAVLESSRE